MQDEAAEIFLGMLAFFGLGLWGLRAIAVCVILLIGGLRLRSLRQSGITLIKTGFWIDLVTGPIVVLPLLLLAALASAEEQTTTSTGDVIGYLSSFVGLAAYVFEIVALLWLINNSRHLPLKAN